MLLGSYYSFSKGGFSQYECGWCVFWVIFLFFDDCEKKRKKEKKEKKRKKIL